MRKIFLLLAVPAPSKAFCGLSLSRAGISFPAIHNQRRQSTMADIDAVESVQVDINQLQKYVTIKVSDLRLDKHKLIVRGKALAEYHVEAGEETVRELNDLGMEAEITGGGRLLHDEEQKKLKLYGHSLQFG
ncbi:unnamed protein product [Chrysoparadoxa australica]